MASFIRARQLPAACTARQGDRAVGRNGQRVLGARQTHACWQDRYLGIEQEDAEGIGKLPVLTQSSPASANAEIFSLRTASKPLKNEPP